MAYSGRDLTEWEVQVKPKGKNSKNQNHKKKTKTWPSKKANQQMVLSLLALYNDARRLAKHVSLSPSMYSPRWPRMMKNLPLPMKERKEYYYRKGQWVSLPKHRKRKEEGRNFPHYTSSVSFKGRKITLQRCIALHWPFDKFKLFF